jgi:hypothetical protein
MACLMAVIAARSPRARDYRLGSAFQQAFQSAQLAFELPIDHRLQRWAHQFQQARQIHLAAKGEPGRRAGRLEREADGDGARAPQRTPMIVWSA